MKPSGWTPPHAALYVKSSANWKQRMGDVEPILRLLLEHGFDCGVGAPFSAR